MPWADLWNTCKKYSFGVKIRKYRHIILNCLYNTRRFTWGFMATGSVIIIAEVSLILRTGAFKYEYSLCLNIPGILLKVTQRHTDNSNKPRGNSVCQGSLFCHHVVAPRMHLAFTQAGGFRHQPAPSRPSPAAAQPPGSFPHCSLTPQPVHSEGPGAFSNMHQKCKSKLWSSPTCRIPQLSPLRGLWVHRAQRGRILDSCVFLGCRAQTPARLTCSTLQSVGWLRTSHSLQDPPGPSAASLWVSALPVDHPGQLAGPTPVFAGASGRGMQPAVREPIPPLCCLPPALLPMCPQERVASSSCCTPRSRRTPVRAGAWPTAAAQ